MEDEAKKAKQLNRLLEQNSYDIVKAIERDPLNAAVQFQSKRIVTMEVYKVTSSGVTAGKSALSLASQIHISAVNSLELSSRLWPEFITIMRALSEDVGKKLDDGYRSENYKYVHTVIWR